VKGIVPKNVVVGLSGSVFSLQMGVDSSAHPDLTPSAKKAPNKLTALTVQTPLQQERLLTVQTLMLRWAEEFVKGNFGKS
jgi:hypothetical protein